MTTVLLDLEVENHGSIFLLRAVSATGREWIDEHIGDDAPRFGGAVAVEHGYIVAIVYGALGDGLGVG